MRSNQISAGHGEQMGWGRGWNAALMNGIRWSGERLRVWGMNIKKVVDLQGLFFFLFLSLYSDSQACILPRWVGDPDHSSRKNPLENEKEPACK